MTEDIDAAGLRARLRAELGAAVGYRAGDLGLYTTDASNYRHVPLAVVLPRTTAEVIAAVGICREFGAPVVPRGGGTSIAGNSSGAGVVIDNSRHLGRVHGVDVTARRATVEPGTVLDDLHVRSPLNLPS